MSRHRPLLHLSFNQDHSCLSVGTKEGYKIFNCDMCAFCYERFDGAVNIVEMLFSTSLLVIVGAGEQPNLSPRKLFVVNTTSGNIVAELDFISAILGVRLNRKRGYVLRKEPSLQLCLYDTDVSKYLSVYEDVHHPMWSSMFLSRVLPAYVSAKNCQHENKLVVVLERKTYIHDLAHFNVLGSIDTTPNTRGLCAFSPNQDNCHLALPASMSSGDVIVYNAMDLDALCQIQAHRSPLTAMAMSMDGSLLATASEQGTVIRVHIIPQATKAFTFRRGTYPATIYSLSFGPPSLFPQLLAATSSSGSVHVFKLDSPARPGNRRPSFLAAVIPDSVNDIVEPDHQFAIIHNSFPPGTRSLCAINSPLDEADTGSGRTARARIFVVTINGHFNVYSLTVGPEGNGLCTLETECTLQNRTSDEISAQFV